MLKKLSLAVSLCAVLAGAFTQITAYDYTPCQQACLDTYASEMAACNGSSNCEKNRTNDLRDCWDAC